MAICGKRDVQRVCVKVLTTAACGDGASGKRLGTGADQWSAGHALCADIIKNA